MYYYVLCTLLNIRARRIIKRVKNQPKFPVFYRHRRNFYANSFWHFEGACLLVECAHCPHVAVVLYTQGNKSKLDIRYTDTVLMREAGGRVVGAEWWKG